MQIVEYTEAVDLTMHGMHDDIYVMHPVAISSMTMQDGMCGRPQKPGLCLRS